MEQQQEEEESWFDFEEGGSFVDFVHESDNVGGKCQ